MMIKEEKDEDSRFPLLLLRLLPIAAIFVLASGPLMICGLIIGNTPVAIVGAVFFYGIMLGCLIFPLCYIVRLVVMIFGQAYFAEGTIVSERHAAWSTVNREDDAGGLFYWRWGVEIIDPYDNKNQIIWMRSKKYTGNLYGMNDYHPVGAKVKLQKKYATGSFSSINTWASTLWRLNT